MEKVIFLDRDGTINEEVHYLFRREDLRIIPGVPAALRRLKEQGYRLVVVTNQAGVGRGYYREEDVKDLHLYMNELLQAEGAEIDGFFYCPHHPVYGIGAYKQVCRCRKPDVGMFEMAERLFDVDKAASWMVGDKETDLAAGRNYGVRTALVGTGYGAGVYEEYLHKDGARPFDLYGATLMDVAEEILRRGRRE
ncbi:MAG: HAD family hydrolase [Eubacteriales bacterium]|nr:HAD family hydrolase [Eubacteriales bacterium]